MDAERGNLRFPDDAPTPVGQICADCKEEIAAGDWGTLIPWVMEGGTIVRPSHGECLVRDVMGGIEHLAAPPGHPVGSCYEGSTLTFRQSAVAAYEWLNRGR